MQLGNAYRIGDIVETEIILNGVVATTMSASSSLILLRSQMPRFGISSTTTLTIKEDNEQQEEDDQQRHHPIQTLALQFEDGLWYSPSVAVVDSKTNQKYPLERIEVQILYSKSGSGAIHAVNAKPVYRSEASGNNLYPGSYTLEYQWIEEEAVRLGGGLSVMFLIVFASSIAFFVISCGGVMETNSTGSSHHHPKSGFPYPHSHHTAIPQGSNNNVPKWD
jgi:hypothetical protein